MCRRLKPAPDIPNKYLGREPEGSLYSPGAAGSFLALLAHTSAPGSPFFWANLGSFTGNLEEAQMKSHPNFPACASLKAGPIRYAARRRYLGWPPKPAHFSSSARVAA